METVEVNDEGEIFDPSLMQNHFCTSDRLHRSAALLLLNAKEHHQLTQPVLSFIIHQIQQMFSFAVDDINEMVKKYSTAQGTLGSIPELEAHLEAMHNSFSCLETEYMQTKFYREYFNLVIRYIVLLPSTYASLLCCQEPVTIKLGGPSSNDTFQYVPLLQGLTSLLQHSEICDKVYMVPTQIRF